MNKSIRTNINKILKKNILIIILMISMCPILGLSYARFIINTDSYRSNEMYIAELLYSVKIDNENKYEIEIPTGESEHIIEITSLNAVASNYKLAYKNNSNLKVEYARDYIDSSYGGIVETRTIMVRVTNNSSTNQKLSLSVFGGYSFNDVKEVIVPNGYTEIKTNYLHYDLKTIAFYVNDKKVEKLNENKDYTLVSYTCENGQSVLYDRKTKTISVTPMMGKAACTLYFKEYEWKDDCNGSNSLRCKVISDNKVYKDNVSSEYVSESTGVNFAKISSLANGQGLYTNNKLEDGKNYYFRGGSFCAYDGYLNEDKNGTKCKAAGGTWSNYKCSFDLSKEACTGYGEWYELKNNVSFAGYMWKIIRIDENGEVRLLYNGNSTTSLGSASHIGTAPYNEMVGDNAFVGYMQPKAPSEYQMSSGVRSNFIESNSSYKMSKTYTYDNKTGIFTLTGEIVNGTYTSEYIGYYTCMNSETTCKKVIKIEEVDKNETTNTNRVKKATILSSKFTTSKQEAESNEIDSKVKEKNDNWYNNNLSSVSNKISKEAGYCNDRTVTRGTGIGDSSTTFASYNRVYNKHTPSYKCENESNDLFTMSTASRGNKKLTYPVGLITSDELAYAGSLYVNYNYHVYTHSGVWYWTMSPAHFSGGSVLVSNLFGHGFFSNYYVYSNYALRPVITLTSDAIVTGGDGSIASPYIVE